MGNSIEDITTLIEFAHQFNSKVYATINTIFDDSEIGQIQNLLDTLAEAKIDALIIQDLGILKLDTHQIPLFASTQTHNYNIERIKFLEQLGIERFILARELSLDKIEEIRNSTKAELEVFIFGALCVSFSGQCYASFASTGRSANRGECSQICRHSFDLKDEFGKTIISEQHLLSLKDLNLEKYLEDLIKIGVNSFKIEGRLKDINYVKNSTAYFRKLIDETISGKHEFKKSSSGKTNLDFTPDINRTFNRGFSYYFIEGRKNGIASFGSPKHIGEEIGEITETGKNFLLLKTKKKISNGDGLTYFNSKNELEGFFVNRVDANKIFPNKMPKLKYGTKLFRNKDTEFESILQKDKSKRKISARIELTFFESEIHLSATDEDGNYIEMKIPNIFDVSSNLELAKNNIEKQLSKTGNSIFEISSIKLHNKEIPFIPLSELNNIRNQILEGLLNERKLNYKGKISKSFDEIPKYFEKAIDYRGNVMNSLARKLYEDAGVKSIEDASEKGTEFEGKVVMTTKYCLKYELGICPVYQRKSMSGADFNERNKKLFLEDNNHKYRLEFDCKQCEMNIIY